MSDLKMSDVFSLPVIEGNFVNEHTRRVCDQKGVFAIANISASSRVAHAINNHDRLVEQIAQLEADKSDLLNVAINLADGWDYEELAHCAGVDANTASRVIELLQKHKEQK